MLVTLRGGRVRRLEICGSEFKCYFCCTGFNFLEVK